MALEYGTPQVMTVTNLHSLASSATAGWQSAAYDNSSTLWHDIVWQIVLDWANTSPANSKGAFVFAYSAIDAATPLYTNPATGSEGTITVTDILTTTIAMPLLGFIPYQTADEKVESYEFSLCGRFGLIAPPIKGGIAIVNHAGAALAASGSTVSWAGRKYT